MNIPAKVLDSKDDRTANDILPENMKKLINQYEIGLLWREDGTILTDNFNMALKRLHYLEDKIAKIQSLKATILKNQHVSCSRDCFNTHNWLFNSSIVLKQLDMQANNDCICQKKILALIKVLHYIAQKLWVCFETPNWIVFNVPLVSIN